MRVKRETMTAADAYAKQYNTFEKQALAYRAFCEGATWAIEQAETSSQFTFVLKYHKLGYPGLITRELQNLGADSLESAVRAAQAMCGDGEGFILKPM